MLTLFFLLTSGCLLPIQPPTGGIILSPIIATFPGMPTPPVCLLPPPVKTPAKPIRLPRL